MHESTAYEYEHLPHDHSIHLTRGIIDCHSLLSIFMIHTDSSSSMHCTSKMDQRTNGSMSGSGRSDEWLSGVTR